MLGQIIPSLTTGSFPVQRIVICLRTAALVFITINSGLPEVQAATTAGPADSPPVPAVVPHALVARQSEFDDLRRKIASGSATLVEVKQSLTETDVGGLTNTVHALYSMGWHRGVYHVLHDMWELTRPKYPEFAWDLIEKAPVRIALASTINRLELSGSNEYLDYIRSHKFDEHEFHRAQVVIALGLNGNPADVEYIKSMADGDNHYVAQSALTALALMDSRKASNAMIDLWKKYRDTPRGNLIQELLQQAYNLTPHHKKTADTSVDNKK